MHLKAVKRIVLCSNEKDWNVFYCLPWHFMLQYLELLQSEKLSHHSWSACRAATRQHRAGAVHPQRGSFLSSFLARTTFAQGPPEESGFLVGWVGFFPFLTASLALYQCILWAKAQQFQQKELHGESLLRGCSGTALSILSLPTWFLLIPFISRYKPQGGNSGPEHIRHAEEKQFKLLQALSGLLSGRCP